MSGAGVQRTGVLLVVNGDYGGALVDAAEVLVGDLDVTVTMVCPADPRASLERRILQAVERVDRGGGLLLLTDLCGSTPANICLAVAERPDCELVAGVNLPMLLKLSTSDRARSAQELAAELQGTGQRSMVVGAELRQKGGARGA
jgi:PTS system mannose-specific IIA component